MTDNDIKKALDELVKLSSGIIINWEINQSDAEAIYKTAKNSLDLINHKDAEIEKLNVELVGMRGACESYKMHYDKAQTEIERFVVKQYALKAVIKRYEKDLEKAKTEAIKEFAERLKEKTYPFPCAIGVENAVTIRVINDLVKEMTESPTKIEHSSLCETESFKFAIDEDGMLTIVGGPKKPTRKERLKMARRMQNDKR